MSTLRLFRNDAKGHHFATSNGDSRSSERTETPADLNSSRNVGSGLLRVMQTKRSKRSGSSPAVSFAARRSAPPNLDKLSIKVSTDSFRCRITRAPPGGVVRPESSRPDVAARFHHPASTPPTEPVIMPPLGDEQGIGGDVPLGPVPDSVWVDGPVRVSPKAV